VGELHSDRPQNRWLGKSWTLAAAETAYARSIAVRPAWFPNYRGMGNRFPFVLPGADRQVAPYYGSLNGNAIRRPSPPLDFARAAIEGESLAGQRCRCARSRGISLSTSRLREPQLSGPKAANPTPTADLDTRSRRSFFTYLAKRFGPDKFLYPR